METEPTRKIIQDLFPQDTDRTWLGQPGGCKRQRQKGLTSIVVAILELNRLQTGIESTQVGQGDNGIIMSKIPKLYPDMEDNEYIKKIHDNLVEDCRKYMENLRRISAGLGMIIKLEEGSSKS